MNNEQVKEQEVKLEVYNKYFGKPAESQTIEVNIESLFNPLVLGND